MGRWFFTLIGKIVLIMSLSGVSFSAPALFVDKNEYMLHVMEDDAIVFSQRVIVGKKSRPTPDLVDQITHVVINPHWNVPSKLARWDVVPKIKKDPTAIERYGYRFYMDNLKQIEVPPETIPFIGYVRGEPFPYQIVQDPGPRNALGPIKFIMTNKRAIYLHGTPYKGLFDLDDRERSSGCIRVEDPIELAEFLLPGVDIRGMLQRYKDERWIKLETPVRVEVGS